VRVARNKVNYGAYYLGPANNLNAPHGLACLPGTGTSTVACSPVSVGQYAVGTGPFTPSYLNSSASGSDTSVTPKFGLSYQAARNTMVYGTISKGFRPSGAQIALPNNCNAELLTLGYANSSGQASSPETYKSDSVWSYEIGAKTRLFGDLIAFNGSLFRIKWSNIQSTVSVNSCLQSLTDNLGSATSQGFDLQATIHPIKPLSIGAQVGYADASFDKDTVINGRRLYTGGRALPNSGAPWSVTISGDLRVPIRDHDYYLHSDYTWKSAERRTGLTDPGSYSYDPNAPVTAGYEIVNARAGVGLEQSRPVAVRQQSVQCRAPAQPWPHQGPAGLHHLCREAAHHGADSFLCLLRSGPDQPLTGQTRPRPLGASGSFPTQQRV
jgi:outer membrane receptor protein involved in Fe transport